MINWTAHFEYLEYRKFKHLIIENNKTLNTSTIVDILTAPDYKALIKLLKNTTMNIIIEKLKKLRDENPALVEAIEKEFPEIINIEPYIKNRQFFMRKTSKDTLYQIVFKDFVFKIKNLKHNSYWSTTLKPSNYADCNSIDLYFLTKSDFRKLAKQSAILFNNLKIVPEHYLKQLHTNLF